jgi:hypothetical protein
MLRKIFVLVIALAIPYASCGLGWDIGSTIREEALTKTSDQILKSLENFKQCDQILRVNRHVVVCIQKKPIELDLRS